MIKFQVGWKKLRVHITSAELKMKQRVQQTEVPAAAIASKWGITLIGGFQWEGASRESRWAAL